LEYLNSLIPLIVDWDSLQKNIIERGIRPLFFKKLPLLSAASLIPADVSTKLQQSYYRTLSRSMLLYDAFEKISIIFNSNGIQVIALKGIYLSEKLYGDIALRQFSDIDLLVRKEDGEKCLEILKELGYRSHEQSITDNGGSLSEIIHYPAMVLNEVSVEIHIKLHRKTEQYSLILDELWKNALPINFNKFQCFTLGFNDLIIYLCIHLDKHFRSNQVQFTSLSDITNILTNFSGTIDWNLLAEDCRRYKCEDVVFKYIVLTHDYFNALVPDSVIYQYKHLITTKDLQLFHSYLTGFIGLKSNITSHVINLNQLKSFSPKVQYVLEALFPPKLYMIQKYQIKSPSFYMFFYPYRWWIGVKGVFKLIVGR